MGRGRAAATGSAASCCARSLCCPKSFCFRTVFSGGCRKSWLCMPVKSSMNSKHGPMPCLIMEYQAPAFHVCRLKGIALQRLRKGLFGGHGPESFQGPREHVALMFDAFEVLVFAGPR